MEAGSVAWRRGRGIALLLATAAVAVLTVGLSVVLAGPRVIDGTGQGGCGGVAVRVPGGGVWHCTFDDEFSGDRINRNVWHVTRTMEYGFHSGPECYVDDDRHVHVGGGLLTLTATRGNTCPVTGEAYESGAVASYTGFSQRYGRFAIRAELPDTTSVQPALWMYPRTTSYGPWPDSGEIDIAEVVGTGSSDAWPHVHYRGADGQETHPGTSCRLAAVASRFHTYVVDWTANEIRFSYDGRTCFRVTDWQPAAPLAKPQPFDQPFFVELELALGTGVGAALPSASTVLPTSMTIDWVRVWGR
jgi:beta-glucanase (GH16 family)